MEKVSDAQYNAPAKVQAAPAPVRLSATGNRPSARAMGDFAPKLAEITDDVLYADVWERPQQCASGGQWLSRHASASRPAESIRRLLA